MSSHCMDQTVQDFTFSSLEIPALVTDMIRIVCNLSLSLPLSLVENFGICLVLFNLLFYL